MGKYLTVLQPGLSQKLPPAINEHIINNLSDTTPHKSSVLLHFLDF